jgi:hypothetical protein
MSGRSLSRKLRALLATTVLATIVIPISIAGADGAGTSKATPKATARQVKGLKATAAALAGQLSALQAKIAALEGKAPPTPAPPQTGGPAGGDLSGSYPNPQIRADTIGSADIADSTITGADLAANTIGSANVFDNAIGSADIANGTIGQVDMATGSVGGAQLVGVFAVDSGPNVVGGNSTGGNAVSCPPGTRLLSGGLVWEFSATNNAGLSVISSAPSILDPGTTWEVAGRNTTGAPRSVFARALCLR